MLDRLVLLSPEALPARTVDQAPPDSSQVRNQRVEYCLVVRFGPVGILPEIQVFFDVFDKRYRMGSIAPRVPVNATTKR